MKGGIPVVSGKWLEIAAQLLREHAELAAKASHDFDQRRKSLSEYMRVNAHNFQTAKSRRDRVAMDFDLQDALDAYRFHSGEQQRLASLILAEHALHQMREGEDA